MSRIRTTLDTVSKAVSGTDLISKISRLKPGAAHAEKVLVKAEPLANDATTAAASVTMTPPEPEQRNGEEKEKEKEREEEAQQQQQQPKATEKSFLAQTKPKASLASSVANTTANSSTVAKQTLQLFHPAALTTSIDETYNTISQHVNDYFGSDAQLGDDHKRAHHMNGSASASKTVIGQRHQSTGTGSGERIPVPAPVAGTKAIDAATPPPPDPPSSPDQASPISGVPVPEPPSTGSPPVPATPTPTTTTPATSPKKGFSHYLSYPRPSVQEFVGSYIAPLVPKFRSNSKSIKVEEEKGSLTPPPGGAVAKAAGNKESEEEEKEKEKGKAAAEEKARRILTREEKIVARVSLDNRTRALVKGLQRVTDVKVLTSRVELLSYHLMEYPETRGVAVMERVLPCLLRLRQARAPALQAAVREALALVGYTDPVKGRGIRVLSIDGGGTRGLVALQTLHKLQTLTGKPIYQLFDYICGVSTGAILAFMLGVFQIPLDECEELYRKLGSDVFKQNVIVGTVKMGWSHAFYDSEIWENILKERMGESVMVESARDPDCPKVSAVSTIVNRGLPLKAYVFRNYSLLPGVRSHYLGDCKHKMWEAIRASSAAPGYFQECVLGKDLHQDGGLLINNPTALAIHECKCLWPSTPVQCVVSLGTGRYETAGRNSTSYTSLKTKITNVISSATDTEEVHTMLDALLPPDTYFRFNPHMTEDIPLDESRREKLNFLQEEGERYLARNEDKLKKAASVLAQEKSAIQRLAEWAKLKADMYEGLPFSKL